MPLVITVKLGVDKEGLDAAGVTVRNTESGEVVGFTFAGSRELLEYLLRAFDSHPEVRVKYE